MPGLQVLSAPTNQPTLNPQVQSAPTQPILAPRVLSAPTNAPTLAPKVVAQPSQPTLNPQVQTQPQDQGKITSIGTADNQQPAKLSVDDFAQLIKQQYPQYADQDNMKLVGTILKKYPQYSDRVFVPIAALPDKPGFIKSLVQGIASPFLREATTIAAAAAAGYEATGAIGDKITGDKAGEQQHIDKANQIIATAKSGVNLGYLGKPTAIKSPIDAAGVGAEIGANFIGGEGAVGAGENIVKGSLKAAIKTGIKAGVESGAVAGLGTSLQKDNPTLGGAIKGTALGGVEGGVIGGALAGVPAAGVEAYRFAKGVKNFIAPDVLASFTKALKPATNNTGFKDAVKVAVPLLTDTEKSIGQPVKNLGDLLNVVKTAKQRVWATVQEQLGKNSNLTIDGNKIADEMVSSIDKRFRVQNPSAAERIVATADTYRRQIPVQEAEQFLESANAELENFYAKSGFKQRATAANPEVGHVVREAEALRSQLNEKISSATGKDFGLLKKQYGALTNLEQTTTKRVNVAERQNPDSLAEQIGLAQGLANVAGSVVRGNVGDAVKGGVQIAASHFIKNKNTSDSLIENAFNQLRKGTPKLKP